MARKIEVPGFAIHAKHGDVVTALIAAIEERACGVEIEAARIVPACPFLRNVCQGALGTYGEDSDTVMQPIAAVNEPTVGGNQNLGAEVAAGKTGRQGRDCLPRG